jgi:hypothetical protein
MTVMEQPQRGVRFHMCGMILGLVALAMPALAASGNVLPSKAKPKGYSLVKIAKATAHFNTSGPTGRSEMPEPSVPFQILYTSTDNPSNAFAVPPGTMLYVPIVFADNSAPILGLFPDVNDPGEVSDYYFNPAQLGAEFIEIVVDGKVTSLDPAYVVGAETPGLPSGGNLYTVAAVFLTPLSPGLHTVTIRARFTGEALEAFPQVFPGGVFAFDVPYSVTVE